MYKNKITETNYKHRRKKMITAVEKPVENKTQLQLRKKRVTFTINKETESEVFVAGSFNNWNHNEFKMKKQNGNGTYSITIYIPKGKHEYKFIVDGNWIIDPQCPEWTINSIGTLNSVIDV